MLKTSRVSSVVCVVALLVSCSGKESGLAISLNSATYTTITGPDNRISQSEPDIATSQPIPGTIVIYEEAILSELPSERSDELVRATLRENETYTVALEPGDYSVRVDDKNCQSSTFEVEAGRQTQLALFCQR